MDRPNIERFLELAEKATKGPWKSKHINYLGHTPVYTGNLFEGGAFRRGLHIAQCAGNTEQANANADFIAAAKNEAPDIARYALLQERALDDACHTLGRITCPIRTAKCERNPRTYEDCIACWRDYFLTKAKEEEV